MCRLAAAWWSGAALAAGAAALALSWSDAAAAADGDSLQLELTGSVQARCGFTESPGNKDIGSLAQGAQMELGTLGFRCNLPGSPQVSLSVKSDHGGLKREGGSELVGYQLAWALPGRGNYVDAATLKTESSFNEASGDIASGRRGALRVQVTGGGELAAGVYRDRISFTISP